IFDLKNTILSDLISPKEGRKIKAAFVIDSGVKENNPLLLAEIKQYFKPLEDRITLTEPLVIQGGEESKNDLKEFQKVLSLVNEEGIDRQSYIIAVGGGAILDMVGFAASIAHRGVKHIR